MLTKNNNKEVQKIEAPSDKPLELKLSEGKYQMTVSGPNLKEATTNIDVSKNDSTIRVAPSLEQDKGTASTQQENAFKAGQDLQVLKSPVTNIVVNQPGIVQIPITVTPGSLLDINVVNNNNNLVTISEKSSKDKFVIKFEPKPGKNIVNITATLPSGQVKELTVTVMYQPESLAVNENTNKIDKQAAVAPGDSLFMAFVKDLEKVSDPHLAALLKLNLTNQQTSKSIDSLYKQLKTEATNRQYDTSMINKAFQDVLSQRIANYFNKS
ncbi:MAG: hypothetical protein HC896_10145 [Bacteroidales bacterium]|nr:hypothetical protein [Bacteroidales bacterium]